MARWAKIAELAKRFIIGKRMTRARINLGIMLIAKPDGTFRFIWNGKPLAKYLVKTDFAYELLSRFLDGVLDGSFLGKLDLVDGFFAIKIKPSQRQYLGFSVINEFGVLEFYEFWVLPQHHGAIHLFPLHVGHHNVPSPYSFIRNLHHLPGRPGLGHSS